MAKTEKKPELCHPVIYRDVQGVFHVALVCMIRHDGRLDLVFQKLTKEGTTWTCNVYTVSRGKSKQETDVWF